MTPDLHRRALLHLKELSVALIFCVTTSFPKPLWRIVSNTQRRARLFCKKDAKGPVDATPLALTPDHEVSRCLVDAPGVARHACVGPSIRDVRWGDEQAAWLEQGEPGQLDRTAGQHALTWAYEEAGEREEREIGIKRQNRRGKGLWEEKDSVFHDLLLKTQRRVNPGKGIQSGFVC